MEERQGKELRIYGFGAYKPLINWLLFMLICSELILAKYLFLIGGIYTKPYKLLAAFILLPVLAGWILLMKIGKLKYLVIQGNRLQYKTVLGVRKECRWEDVDMVNVVGVNINIWLDPKERFARFNKYVEGAEELERLYEERKVAPYSGT